VSRVCFLEAVNVAIFISLVTGVQAHDVTSGSQSGIGGRREEMEDEQTCKQTAVFVCSYFPLSVKKRENCCINRDTKIPLRTGCHIS
jgi:hypothetical protein